MMHCAPRAVRKDVDADAERVVHGLSFAVEGGGMTQVTGLEREGGRERGERWGAGGALALEGT